jgi:Phosphoketolase
MPDFRKYAVEVKEPGQTEAQDMMEFGKFVRDIFAANEKAHNFRIFSPDEGMSNRLNHAQKLVDKPPITQKQLQDAVDDYIEYYGGTYLKYGCMLVNAFGRPKLYDDEKAEENAKHWN